MAGELSLDGTMIPRRVKRMFDQRREPRLAAAATALFDWRGTSLSIRLGNLSASGAMLICDEIPNIGEAVTLHLRDRAPMPAVVQWVRGGRIGIHFTAPLG